MSILLARGLSANATDAWLAVRDMPVSELRRWVTAHAEELGFRLPNARGKKVAARMKDMADRALFGDARTWADPTPEAVFKRLCIAR